MNSLSVIVPIYNTSAKYLKTCLDSLVNTQKHKIEIILVNDCSSKKETIELCKEYNNKYESINLVNLKQNQGVSNARNTGILKAKNDLIMFVDADDWISDNCYDTIFKNFKKEMDILIFNANIVYEKSSYENNFLNYKKNTYIKDYNDIKVQIIHKPSANYVPKFNCIGVTWGKVYKKTFLLNNEIRFKKELKRAEDHIFFLNALEYNPTIYYITSHLYNYRKNEESAVNKHNKNVKETFRNTLAELKKYIGPEKKLEEVYNRRCISYIFASLTNDYFHKDNDIRYKDFKSELSTLCQMEPYKESLKKVDPTWLSKNKKIIICLLKRKHYYLIWLIYKAKKMLKG